jgi:hypothetical protein
LRNDLENLSLDGLVSELIAPFIGADRDDTVIHVTLVLRVERDKRRLEADLENEEILLSALGETSDRVSSLGGHIAQARLRDTFTVLSEEVFVSLNDAVEDFLVFTDLNAGLASLRIVGQETGNDSGRGVVSSNKSNLGLKVGRNEVLEVETAESEFRDQAGNLAAQRESDSERVRVRESRSLNIGRSNLAGNSALLVRPAFGLVTGTGHSASSRLFIIISQRIGREDRHLKRTEVTAGAESVFDRKDTNIIATILRFEIDSRVHQGDSGEFNVDSESDFAGVALIELDIQNLRIQVGYVEGRIEFTQNLHLEHTSAQFLIKALELIGHGGMHLNLVTIFCRHIILYYILNN